MKLKMFTGNILVAQADIDLIWCETAGDRQKLMENVAAAMRREHAGMCGPDTVFFVHAKSKINYIEVEEVAAAPRQIIDVIKSIIPFNALPPAAGPVITLPLPAPPIQEKKAAAAAPRYYKFKYPKDEPEPERQEHAAGVYSNPDHSKKYLECPEESNER